MVRVPLNMRNSGREHLYILNNSEARAVIVGEEFTETIGSILPEAKMVTQVLCVNGTPPAPMLSYEELIAKASPEDPDVEMTDEDIHRLSYTSGTTGQPKGVVQDNRAAMMSLYNVLIDGLDIQPSDVVALTSPVTHASGSMILPPFYTGGQGGHPSRIRCQAAPANHRKRTGHDALSCTDYDRHAVERSGSEKI